MIAAAITLVVYFPLVSFDKQPFVAEGTFRSENGESFRNIAQMRDPTYFTGKGICRWKNELEQTFSH